MQNIQRTFLINLIWWGLVIFLWMLFVETDYKHEHFDEIHSHSLYFSFSFLATLLLATFNTIAETIWLKRGTKYKVSFRKKLLIIFLQQFIFILTSSIMLFVILKYVLNSPESGDFSTFTERANIISFWFYAGIAAYVLEIVKAVDQKLGRGNLWRMIIGTFSKPIEMTRVFMFVDLFGSTRLAERMGKVRYSELLQDCFHDVSVVQQYGAEVFQYVGDEVVLVWKPKVGLKNWNCIKAYYGFVTRLNEKEDYYRKKYGEVPYFKAGVHIGPIVLAEVGELKRELAYHGDTMNITARIQHCCNELNQSLIASENLIDTLNSADMPSDIELEPLGPIDLRGKKSPVNIVGIRSAKTLVQSSGSREGSFSS